MRVVAFGKQVSLGPSAQLGDGGEAVVFRHAGHALKIWHEPTPARVAKVEALIASGLPPAALAPNALVHDAKGRAVLGFAMDALPPAYEPVALLGRKARAVAGLGTRAAVRVVRGLVDALEALHAAGVVVGDLNDQNEVFDPVGVGVGAGAVVRLLDVDSFHLPGHPCVVATEAYLDPRLYGPDLAHPVALPAGLPPRAFGPSSDRYALAVLLFRALTLVHPYGGTHPSLPTIARRAAARVSVFARSVTYPRAVGLALDVLGDELARALRSVFDDDDRRPVTGAMLDCYAASLVACGDCGFEYPGDGRACPSCAALAPAPVLADAAHVAGARADVLVELAGPALALAADDAALACVSVERGRLVHRRVGLDAAGRARGPVAVTDLGAFALGAGDHVAVGPEIVAVARPRAHEHEHEHVFTVQAYAATERGAELAFESTTEARGGKAALACGQRAVFRLAAGHVVAATLARGAAREPEECVLAQVVRGGTRLVAAATAAGDAVVAFERALGVRTCTLARAGRVVDLALAPLERGDAVDREHALVDPLGRGVVVLRAIRRAGVALVVTDVFDAAGARLASRLEPEASRLAGASLEGLALVDPAHAEASLVVATQAGLARERITPRGLEGRRAFPATEPFVAPDAALCLLPGGAVASALGRAVRRLEPR